MRRAYHQERRWVASRAMTVRLYREGWNIIHYHYDQYGHMWRLMESRRWPL